LLKIFAVLEPMALQDVFDPAVEPLDHAICLWSHWWRKAIEVYQLLKLVAETLLSG
jgi:hypothetical protein